MGATFLGYIILNHRLKESCQIICNISISSESPTFYYIDWQLNDEKHKNTSLVQKLLFLVFLWLALSSLISMISVDMIKKLEIAFGNWMGHWNDMLKHDFSLFLFLFPIYYLALGPNIYFWGPNKYFYIYIGAK